MSDDAPSLPDDDAPAKPNHRPGLAGLALLLAAAALLVAAWSGWRLHQAGRASASAARADAVRVAALESRLAASGKHAEAGDARIVQLQSSLADLRADQHGLERRIANLETGFANLSGQQQSAHDTLLLDDAELLLRTAQQRYELFHDATGALAAYGQAITALAQVQNPAYAPVKTSAATERDALAAAAPPDRQAALDTLSTLRGKVAGLPLAQPEAAAKQPAQPGLWSRVGRAFSGIVTVSRDDGGKAPLMDARFARQSLALDLAQAQEAMLAFDSATANAALTRADALLATNFDAHDAGVSDARNDLAGLLARHAAGKSPQLGGALAQLRSLRASQAAAATPAPASTSAAAKP